MSRQYKRAYKLLVGDSISALEITDLRVAFEITKDILGFPNLAKIEVYNLNETSRGKIKDEFTRVVFNAGYEGNIRQLFVGDIRNVNHRRSGVDIITEIYAADGDRDYRESFTNITLSEGAEIKDIVSQITSSFSEVTTGTLKGLDGIKQKVRGVTLTGQSKDILDTLGEDYGFDWSIQNGVFETIGKDETFDDVVVVSNQTGMLESPTITEIGADVKILLNPRVLPNRMIKIESGFPQFNIGNLYFREIKKTLGEGEYKVQKVIHTGDTHADDWYSQITGRAL